MSGYFSFSTSTTELAPAAFCWVTRYSGVVSFSRLEYLVPVVDLENKFLIREKGARCTNTWARGWDGASHANTLTVGGPTGSLTVGEFATEKLGNSVTILEYRRRGRVVDPAVQAPDVRFPVGALVNWESDAVGTWGINTTKTVPPYGEIKVVSLIGGTDPMFTDDNVTWTKIGSREHTIEVRDDHSLSPLFPFDNTFTTAARTITIYTPASP